MDTKKLTIVQINDVHGHIESHNEIFFDNDGFNVREAGGYARIKTLVDKIKEENPNTIF